jgi:hypothetical protein
MNGNNMMATKRKAADDKAGRLLGLLSSMDCQRFQPRLHWHVACAYSGHA